MIDKPMSDHARPKVITDLLAVDDTGTVANYIRQLESALAAMREEREQLMKFITQIAEVRGSHQEHQRKAERLVQAFTRAVEPVTLPSERATAPADLADLVRHLERQSAFSEKTFGPGVRTAGVVDHIRKELREIEAKPHDLSEWIDVAILAFDGAWRAGYSPAEIVSALVAKQTKNEARTWPDWRTAAPDKAIEHVRVDKEGVA